MRDHYDFTQLAIPLPRQRLTVGLISSVGSRSRFSAQLADARDRNEMESQNGSQELGTEDRELGTLVSFRVAAEMRPMVRPTAGPLPTLLQWTGLAQGGAHRRGDQGAAMGKWSRWCPSRSSTPVNTFLLLTDPPSPFPGSSPCGSAPNPEPWCGLLAKRCDAQIRPRPPRACSSGPSHLPTT